MNAVVKPYNLIAKMITARAKAYEDAAILLELELLGDDIQKAQRKNVIGDLRKEAKSLQLHAQDLINLI